MRAVYYAVTNVLLLLICLALPFPTEATTQAGKTLTGTVAICESKDDAATLIGITTKYGQNTGIGWMQEDDNTCILTSTTFTVGEVEVDGIKDKTGQPWMILQVTANGDPHYIVMPSSAYQSASH